MKSVKIYKLQNNGDQTVIATCSLATDGLIICEGEGAFVENLQREGIKDYVDVSGGKILFPRDGIGFLENLKYAFRSGYLSASDIEEATE